MEDEEDLEDFLPVHEGNTFDDEDGISTIYPSISIHVINDLFVHILCMLWLPKNNQERKNGKEMFV